MKKVCALFLIILLALTTGCQQQERSKAAESPDNPASKTQFLMGTVVTVRIYDKGKGKVLKPVFQRIRELANATTVEDKARHSQIDKINQNAGIKPVRVSKNIYQMLKVGASYSSDSNGTFDLTIGPLSRLWHIGFPDARKPAQSEIDKVLPLIDYQKMVLNDSRQTVFLKEKGMRLDLGAIAKGFITDEAVAVLKAHGVHSAIVDLGGNIFVVGKGPSGNRWNVGIQNPFSPHGEIAGKIAESNKTIVTSGIYERFIKVGGKTYHHLLNPDNGYPFNNDIASVSVVTDRSIDGDCLSTTLFAEGVKAGFEKAEKLKGVEAIFITRDKKIYLTSGLKKNFVLMDKSFEVVN
ncbi:MAG: FAD:protein FMN transferase [Sporolactobacillus sp.]